jgi:phenylalanyl-tRNA synthetase beta chain
MRVSWKWLNEMLDLSAVGGPDGLARLLTSRGLEVEAVERQDQGLEKVVTAQILERAKHPEADRLSLCKVTTGSGEPMEIVCGAQNMKAGDKVALAQVGAHLPNGVKIAAGKIRGVVSNGMLCSEEELKLKDSSEGILILPAATKLGQPLAAVLGRDDVILTLKLTANRGDCLSHYGLAREIGAALGQKPKRPEAPALKEGGSPIAIDLQAGDSAPQFLGCFIEGVKIGPSPDWLVRRLEALGSRSINNVVDASNLVMFELGHPTHAYDAERIEGGKIGVRDGKAGEKLPLLDGTEITLKGGELVIADAKRAVGLAGVMGGGNSEVTDGTTRLFLECAQFEPGRVRRAATAHDKKTDAAHRFERGVDPRGLEAVIARLAGLITELAGGKIKGAVVARRPGHPAPPREVRLEPAYLSEALGMAVEPARARKILESLECKVAEAGEGWKVQPPSYRNDLSIREDFVEEVARSLGYDAIPETVPPLTGTPRTIHASPAMARFQLDLRAKDALAACGLSEQVCFAFTSRAWLDRLGVRGGVALRNPISEEHEVLLPSLLPNLIRSALESERRHFGSEPLPIRLFELRPTFHGPAGEVSAQGELETGVQERWRLGIALSGPRFPAGLRVDQAPVDFFDLKGMLEQLFEALGARGVRMQPLSASRSGGHPLFHPGQGVEILAGKDVAGWAGLMHPGKAQELKLRSPLWLAELDWDALAKLSRPVTDSVAYKAWPQYPQMERDFALLVRNDVSADKITQVAQKAGRPLAKIAKVFDVYQGSPVPEGMTSVAVRVIFYEESRSLQESEAEAASAQILDAWKKELGAQLRS